MMGTLLAALGVLIVMSGGWLAHAGTPNIERQRRFDRLAGFLIMAGLGCIGGAFGLWFGSPLP